MCVLRFANASGSCSCPGKIDKATGGQARPSTSGGGFPVWQESSARRQRGWNVQPDGRAAGLGGFARRGGRHGAGGETRHRRQQRLRIGMARCAENLLRAYPARRSVPRYITATSAQT